MDGENVSARRRVNQSRKAYCSVGADQPGSMGEKAPSEQLLGLMPCTLKEETVRMD